MAFERGNKLAAKSKLFDHELRKAIAQGDPNKLRAIAEKLLDKAAEGDLGAISMLADRLDGKPTQFVDATIQGELNVGDGDTFRDKLSRSLGSRQTPTVQ